MRSIGTGVRRVLGFRIQLIPISFMVQMFGRRSCPAVLSTISDNIQIVVVIIRNIRHSLPR